MDSSLFASAQSLTLAAGICSLKPGFRRAPSLNDCADLSSRSPPFKSRPSAAVNRRFTLLARLARASRRARPQDVAVDAVRDGETRRNGSLQQLGQLLIERGDFIRRQARTDAAASADPPAPTRAREAH